MVKLVTDSVPSGAAANDLISIRRLSAVRVGFVGLGSLGAPIAHRILKAELTLTLWARRSVTLRSFESTPAAIASSLEELGAASEIVCLCVVDEPDLHEVLRGGLLAGMTPESVLVIHSTVSPDACTHIARLVEPLGIGVVDAPLCGGPPAAAIGALPIPVGGHAVLVDRCRPLLEAYGGLVRHCGALGSGQVVKLLFNLLYAANVEIIYDALGIGVGYGLDRELLAQFFTALPYTGFVGGALATGRASPDAIRHGRNLLEKDVNYMRELLAAAEQSEGKVGPLAQASLVSLATYLEEAS